MEYADNIIIDGARLKNNKQIKYIKRQIFKFVDLTRQELETHYYLLIAESLLQTSSVASADRLIIYIDREVYMYKAILSR